MSQIRKGRFTLSKDDSDLTPDEIKTNRLGMEGLAGKRYMPLIIVSSVALAAIILVVVLTFVYKKPGIFAPKDKQTAVEIPLGDTDKKLLPQGDVDNIHLKRGIESYHKGYFNDALAEFNEVVESSASDREKAMALTYIGIIYDDRGDYAKAIESYNRALTYDRKNPITYRNLSLAYRHRKDYEKAMEYAEKAVGLDSGNVNNRILLGNILYDRGDYKGAVEEYQAALKIEPENGTVLYNLAMALLKKGDEVAAIEYFKRAGASDKIGDIAGMAYGKLGVLFTQRKDFDLAEKYLKLASSVKPSDPVVRYNLGIVYLKQNKNEEALKEFLKAEEMGKGDPRILESLGEAFFSLRDYQRSIDTYNRVLESNRRNVRILSRIAEIYYEKGDLDRAYEFYHKITTLEPASENARMAYLNMGNILDDAQRFDEAIEAYQKSLAISPKDADALYNLGIAYKHAGKPELAIESWRKAADMSPDNPQALMALADYYYEKGHLDMAMDEYQVILRRWPNIQEGHFNLAAIYFKKNLLDYSREEYKRVIEINDRNDFARKAYINLGVIASKTGKPGDETAANAMGYVQKALLLKPGDGDALYALGTVYAKQEMCEKAIDTFMQALRATSDGKLISECYNNIGKCYYKQGKYKKALQSFTRGIEEDPTNEEIRMNRKTAMQAYEDELARK